MFVMMYCSSGRNSIFVKDFVSLVNSVMRILATMIIYKFHCEMQYDTSSKHHLFIAFSFFLFISGYYSTIVNKSPVVWIVDRLKRIYIPYWVVIAGVVVVNLFADYKEVGYKELFFLLIGGNLFVEHKLYVIAWFVSAIVIMYLCVFVMNYFRYISVRIVILVSLVCLLMSYGMPIDFFIFFGLGYAIHSILIQSGLEFKYIFVNDNVYKFYNTVAIPIRFIQDFSYEFFLVHGGVVLFFTKIIHTQYYVALYGGLVATIVGAIALKKIASKIGVLLDI